MKLIPLINPLSLLIIIIILSSFCYNYPIESTHTDAIVYKVMQDPFLYNNHISFTKEFFQSPYFKFNYLVSQVNNLLNNKSLNIILISLYFISCLFSAWVLIRIVNLLFEDDVNRLICYFIICSFWMFDLNLIGNGYHLSTLHDELRHYIIGLPLLIFATLLFLIEKKFLAGIVWALIPWISPSSFVIGSPLGLGIILILFKDNKIRSLFQISIITLFILIFFYNNITIDFLQTKDDWWYSIAYMSSHDSLLSHNNKSIRNLLLSLMCFISVSYYVFIKMSLKTNYFNKYLNKIIYLSIISLLLFFLCFVITDLLKLKVLIGKEVLIKILWFASFGAMFIYPIYILRYMNKTLLPLCPILLFPVSKFSNASLYYIFFLLFFYLIEFIKNKSNTEKFFHILFPFVCIFLFFNNPTSFEKGFILVLLVLFIFDLVHIQILKTSQISVIRLFNILFKYKKTFASIIILCLLICHSFVRFFLYPPKEPLIVRKIASKEFQETCNIVNGLSLKSSVLIPPDDNLLQTTYFLLSTKPLLSIYYPELMLRAGIFSPNKFKEIYMNIWGRDVFSEIPVKSEMLLVKSQWFRDSLNSKWKKINSERLKFLKKEYNCSLIIRENEFPLNENVIFQNNKYTIYNIK